MPKVNLSNYGPLVKTLEDTLLEKLKSLSDRIRPGIQPWDVVTLMDTINYGIDCLMDLMAPQRNIPFIGKTPHTAHYFARDADGVEDAYEQLSHLENPSANLAVLGDSFVPEVRSALLQLVALLRQKQREYEAMEAATGGRRKTHNARKPRSNRHTHTARNRHTHTARNRHTHTARNRHTRNARNARNRV